MRSILTILGLLIAGIAAAQGLSNAPPSRVFTIHEPPPADAEQLRQGGDTWEDAVTIPGIPYLTSGTNVGYTVNCCIEMCPYEAWGPAVFYSFTPSSDVVLRIDLCGSDFDTGLYVFTADHDVVACNIDYYDGPPCGLYVSCLEAVPLVAGEFYYVVVTGMGGDSGNYELAVTEFEICEFDPPTGAVFESEPPLEDGYADAFNGGCNSPEFGAPFQPLSGDAEGRLEFAGRGGWYVGDDGGNKRDTDWFTAIVGSTGLLEIELFAEQESFMFELGPQDCESVGVLQQATAPACEVVSMTVTGEPGSAVWLWVGASTFTPPEYPPGNEYDYVLTINGLQPSVVAVDRQTWSAVKNLYR